jgi:hypothetical protein
MNNITVLKRLVKKPERLEGGEGGAEKIVRRSSTVGKN